MLNKLKFLFILIFIITFFIRIFKLTDNPEGFDQTEAAFAYNAFSIAKTGRDEYGKFLPLVLVSIGDYKLANFSYWEIPFITLFGLNEFAARLSVVTAGMISLILIYFVTCDLFKNRKLALLTLFFVGISPWHTLMSRMAYDPMIAFMWYLFSIFLFIRWYRKEKLYYFILSAITLAFSISTYYAVWLLFPFTILLYWIFIFRKRITLKKLIYLTIILLIPVITIVKLFVITSGQRLYQDSTFQTDAFPLLEEQIREDQHTFPLFITRLFHNKLTFYPLFIFQNLFNNLSIDFLFLNGDKIDRRFYVPYSGVLYLIMAPLFFLGVLYFWKNYSLKKNLFIFFSIFIIFLGSAFSPFGSETERTLFSVPLFCFLISYGLIIVYSKRKKNIFFSIILAASGILFIFNIAYFSHQYFWHGNVHQPWGRNYGDKEMVKTVHDLDKNYKNVFIAGNPYIYFYFYDKVDPKDAQLESQELLPEVNYLGSRLRSKVENYFFMSIDCPAAGKLGNLYICKGSKIPKNSKVIKVLRYRDNQPVWIFLEFTHLALLQVPPPNLDYMTKYGIIPDRENINWLREDQL